IMNKEKFDDIAEMKKTQAHNENVNSRRIGTCCFLFSLAFVLLVVGDVYPFWTLHQGRNYHYDQYASYGGNSDFSKLVGYVTIVSLVLGATSILVSVVMVFGSFYPDIREYQHIAFRINVAIAALGGVHAIHACVIFLVDVYAMSPSIPHNTVPGWSFYLVFSSGLVELIGGWLCSTLEYHFTEMVEHVDHVDIFQNH
ncbi:hypothetical protein Bpfe_028868, partial [Biomphalaria pfeifferi]